MEDIFDAGWQNRSAPRDATVDSMLASLIDVYGLSLLDEPDQLRSLLAVSFPTDRLRVAALLDALALGVPQRMHGARNDDRLPPLLRDSVVDLQRRRALDPALATWAVQTWAHALALPAAGLEPVPAAPGGDEPTGSATDALDPVITVVETMTPPATVSAPLLDDRPAPAAALPARSSGDDAATAPPATAIGGRRAAPDRPPARGATRRDPIPAALHGDVPRAPGRTRGAPPAGRRDPSFSAPPAAADARSERNADDDHVAVETPAEIFVEPLFSEQDLERIKRGEPPTWGSDEPSLDAPAQPAVVAPHGTETNAFAGVPPTVRDEPILVPDDLARDRAGPAADAVADAAPKARSGRRSAIVAVLLVGAAIGLTAGLLADRWLPTAQAPAIQRAAAPRPGAARRADAPAPSAATTSAAGDTTAASTPTQPAPATAADRVPAATTAADAPATDRPVGGATTAAPSVATGAAPGRTGGDAAPTGTAPPTTTPTPGTNAATPSPAEPSTPAASDAAPAPATGPAIARIDVPRVAEGEPFTVTLRLAGDGRNVASVQKRIVERGGLWPRGSTAATPTAFRRSGNALSIPFRAMDAPSRAVVEFMVVARDGSRGEPKFATVVVGGDPATPAATAACGPANCGTVIETRELIAESGSQNAVYQIVLRMDDGDVRSFSAPYRPQNGMRMQRNGDRVAPVDGTSR